MSKKTLLRFDSFDVRPKKNHLIYSCIRVRAPLFTTNKRLYVLNNISTREDKQEWGHWSSSLPQCKFSVFHCIVCRRMNIERSWLVCMRCGRRIFILFVCKSVNFQYSLYVEYSGAQSGKEDIQRRFYFIHYRNWLRFKAREKKVSLKFQATYIISSKCL